MKEIKYAVSTEFWKQHGNMARLSREAGVDRTTLRTFLYTDDGVTLSTLLKICDALGLKLEVKKRD